MEQIKQRNSSFSYFTDVPFRKLIEEFLHLHPLSKQSSFELFIDFFYKECRKDKALYSKKNIQLDKLKMKHIIKIQDCIQNLIKDSEGAQSTVASSYLNSLGELCKFLTKKELIKIYYRVPKARKNPKTKTIINSHILMEFEKFMILKNYALTTNHGYVTSVKCFLEHSNYKAEIKNSNIFWSSCIDHFEEYLTKKVLSERIAPNTAYAYLKAVRLFYSFLFEKKYINFKYTIPKRFIHSGKRSNEYVSMQNVLLILDKIFEISNDVLRDISIFLIILETGCRPIEVVNLNIEDVYFHEKLIVLKSIKSHQRSLCLTETTLSLIKDYLQIRKNYLPIKTQTLFLAASGTPISSESITHMFRKYNFLTFNEIRFTAKTFRHTFITNALNNDNNINQVKDVVGHKH